MKENVLLRFSIADKTIAFCCIVKANNAAI